jgi:hypothetical protein
MKQYSRYIPLFFTYRIIGFYTAFVLQQLWNWFVVPALHVEPAGYWVMYGIDLLILMIRQPDTLLSEEHWKMAHISIGACIPLDKQQQVREELKSQEDMVWVTFAFDMANKIVVNTAFLAIGWGVQTFSGGTIL